MLCSQARHSRLAPERIFLNFLTGTCEQRILYETGASRPGEKMGTTAIESRAILCLRKEQIRNQTSEVAMTFHRVTVRKAHTLSVMLLLASHVAAQVGPV